MVMMMFRPTLRPRPMWASQASIQMDIGKKIDAIHKLTTCINQLLDKFKRTKVWPYLMVLPSFKVSCGRTTLVSSQWTSRVKKTPSWQIPHSWLASRIRIRPLIQWPLRKHSFKKLRLSKMKTSARSSNSWLCTKVTVLEKKQMESSV